MLATLEYLPLVGYQRLRSLAFELERGLLGLALGGHAGVPRELVSPDLDLFAHIIAERDALLWADAQNIAEGIYPAAVLRPESPLDHLARLPRIALDGLNAAYRRWNGLTSVFDRRAADLLDEVPTYYRRNFHHQTNGYLSEDSAELYDHQVELLFGGAGDAMRRLALRPVKEHLGGADGRGLMILEIGAGTGRATRALRLALPKARIAALDLSAPYLKVARRKLAPFDRIDFLEADAADLPFADARFDAVVSVFVLHEMPLAVRRAVLAEAVRVLKPSGVVVVVDSIQLGEHLTFDSLLTAFPQTFHEPFYSSYVSHRLEPLLLEAGLQEVRTSYGFLSKVCWGQPAGARVR